MADLDVSAVVSRTSGGDLELSDPGTYEVVSIGPGGRTWRRRLVSGPYMHGHRSLGEVLESMTVPMVVRVYGSSWVQVNNRAQTLIDALSQHAYTLTVTIDTVVHKWACEPADVTLVGGDSWQKHHAMAHMQEYQITAPRDPVPIQGSM